MKKIISLLLVLLLLVGCGTSSNATNYSSSIDESLIDISNTYTEKLENFECKNFNVTNTVDNEEFREYEDRVFVDLIEDDFTIFNSLIRDYEKLGIEKPEVNLGEISYEADNESINNEIDELEELLSFDYDSLSYSQQIDYECLEYSFYEDLSTVAYWKYSKFFLDSGGFVENLISFFTDYRFIDEEDVEDYLLLLADVDRYISDALTYTDNQYADGIYYSDNSIDNTIDSIDSYISKEDDNVLITTFKNTINSLDFLTEEEKEDYINENNDLVIDEVLPSFKDLKKKLKTYKGKLDSADTAVCNISGDYAMINIMINSSDNTPMDEVFDNLIDSYNEMVTLVNSYDEDSEIYQEYDELYYDDMFSQSYSELIDFLIDSTPNNTIKSYLEYKISDIDESVAGNSTLAYYEAGELDVLNDNIIRVNPSLTDKNIELYMTLAHEAVPGHMYQRNYYKLTDPAYIREAMSFLGYTEGYATYSEYTALGYLDISEELKNYVTADNMKAYLLMCILDMAINYYGYTNKKIADMFSANTSAVDYYVDLLTDMPCEYEAYGVGYLNIFSLYTNTKEELGDKFDLDEFNELLVKNGSMPLPVLRKLVDDYVATKKASTTNL